MERLAVQGPADGVHHAAQQLVAHADVGHAAGAVDRRAGEDGVAAAQKRRTDAVEAHVQGDAVDVALELQQLAVLGVGKTGHADDAVGVAVHGAVFVAEHLRLVVPELVPQEGAQGALVKVEHGAPPVTPASAAAPSAAPHS